MIAVNTWIRAAYLARSCSLDWWRWAFDTTIWKNYGGVCRRAITPPESWEHAGVLAKKFHARLGWEPLVVVPGPKFQNGDIVWRTDPHVEISVGGMALKQGANIVLWGSGSCGDFARLSLMVDALFEANLCIAGLDEHQKAPGSAP